MATDLSEFLSRFDEYRDGFWTACLDRRVEGSIAIDALKADSVGAHLRWYILSPALHGQGIGKRLLATALEFCRNRKYAHIYLWTFDGLHTARHLYEQNGFNLVHEQTGSQWGTLVTEQKFVCEF